MSNILLTAAQEARQARNAEIVEKFKQYREQFPDATETRIFVKIAQDYSILWSQVRLICKKEGVC